VHDILAAFGFRKSTRPPAELAAGGLESSY
jgi:hypothetical protein